MIDDDELEARAIEVLQALQARAAGRQKPTLTVAELYERYESVRRFDAPPGFVYRADAASVLMRKKTLVWRCIRDRVKPFVDMFGTRDVMSLKVFDWTDYRTVRRKTEIPTGKPGRVYCDNTINVELRTLRAMLNWAVTEGRIPYNPLAPAKAVRTRTKRETAPTEQEVGAMLSLSDPRRVFVVLAGQDVGLRQSESRYLRHSWIDRETMTVNLEGWCCKGNKPRTVPITSRFLEAIDALPRHIRSPYVLTNQKTGDPYSGDLISRWYREVAAEAKVQAAPEDGRVRQHDGRHGFARNAAKRGVRLEHIQAMLGHADISTTMGYVGKADAADMATARETFEAGILRDQERRPAKHAERPPKPDRTESA